MGDTETEPHGRAVLVAQREQAVDKKIAEWEKKLATAIARLKKYYSKRRYYQARRERLLRQRETELGQAVRAIEFAEVEQ